MGSRYCSEHTGGLHCVLVLLLVSDEAAVAAWLHAAPLPFCTRPAASRQDPAQLSGMPRGCTPASCPHPGENPPSRATPPWRAAAASWLLPDVRPAMAFPADLNELKPHPHTQPLHAVSTQHNPALRPPRRLPRGARADGWGQAAGEPEGSRMETALPAPQHPLPLLACCRQRDSSPKSWPRGSQLRAWRPGCHVGA